LSSEVKYIQFESLGDMISLLAGFPNPLIHHAKLRGTHIYFVTLAFLGGTFVYFIVNKEELGKKYIYYHIYKHETSFSDTYTTDPNIRCIPILNVKKQNILSEDILD